MQKWIEEEWFGCGYCGIQQNAEIAGIYELH
jgi:hypothetical protein